MKHKTLPDKQTDDRERRDLRPSIGPGSEFEKTGLNVQREIFNVNVTGGFVGGRRKPGDQAVVMNDGFGVHPQLVVTVGTGCLAAAAAAPEGNVWAFWLRFFAESKLAQRHVQRKRERQEERRRLMKRERKRRRRRAIVSLRETPSLTRLFWGAAGLLVVKLVNAINYSNDTKPASSRNAVSHFFPSKSNQIREWTAH